MHIHQSKILQNNHFLKAIAFIIGSLLWSIMSESHRSHITLPIPLYVYNHASGMKIDGPESITVTLAGPRIALRKLDYTQLGAHVDANLLHAGKNTIALTARDLLLPDDIILVKYTPVHLMLVSQES